MNIKTYISEELNKNLIDKKSIKLIKDSLNSEIYSIIYKGKDAILKIYKSNDPMRIKRETEVLKFLNKKNYQNIPKLYSANLKNQYIIISYLKGEVPNSNINFVNQLADYINKMQFFVELDDKKKLPYAAEACFSLNGHFEKTITKITDIRNKLKEFKYTSETIEIIDNQILPWIQNYKKDIQFDSEFNKNIQNRDMILSQSDIGIHNTFIYNKELYTFDYEYSGLDDPSKTICDLIINPNILLTSKEMVTSLNQIISLKIFNNSYKKSLIILPLYRYKWFTIILNSFIKNFNNENSNPKFFLFKARNYLKNTLHPIKSLLYDLDIKI